MGGLQRANQHAGSMPRVATYDVQTPMDAMGKIDICPARRTEQDGVAARRARKGVRRRLTFIVGFGLDDNSANTVQ